LVGKFAEAFDDYTAAIQFLQAIYNVHEKTQQADPNAQREMLKLHQDINELRADIERVRLLRECNDLKTQADKMFAANQLNDACGLYDKVRISSDRCAAYVLIVSTFALCRPYY
jgi:hypothetical protein